MSPRPYKLGQRLVAAEQTRSRIIAAARGLLKARAGSETFTIEAVARRAGVARMTVYYQFGSKRGLLEALFDDLAGRVLAQQLPAAFSRADPQEALAEYIAAFGRFWGSDRVVIRRARALAALDPVVGEALRARDARRVEGLRTILTRIAGTYGRPAPKEIDEAVRVLHTLTSFETFDALAGTSGRPEDVTPIVRRLGFAVLGLEQPG